MCVIRDMSYRGYYKLQIGNNGMNGWRRPYVVRLVDVMFDIM